MARKTVDEKLAELEAAVAAVESAATTSAGPEALTTLLGKALTDRQARVVALAARLAADKLVYDCVPALLAAYPTFLDKPTRRDPSCIAKKAILRAVYRLDCDDATFYREVLRYRQPEPVWGGTTDTAVDLRCTAAMGLVASGDPRALVDVADLLLDEEAPARAGAARAIACGNPRDAELLLRLKARVGDEDPLVLGDCFAGLLTVEPDESVGFVAGYLESADEAVCEAAALALGESRLPAALECLQRAWDGVYVPDWMKRVIVRAAAVHRSDTAFDWLIGLVRESPLATASHVVETLAIYGHNARLSRDLERVVTERNDAQLAAVFDRVWER